MQIDTSKIRLAQRVLDEVKSLLRKVTPRKGYLPTPLSLNMYSNGREQGYAITLWQGGGKSVRWLFSEHRNSDRIVVYFGTGMFDLTDEEYREAAFFDTPQEAAKAIVSHIRELVR